MKDLLLQFSQLGTVYGLAFSGQEVLKSSILGFDGIQRKLLVLKKQSNHARHSVVIDLNEVSNCSVKKYYGAIEKGSLRKKKLAHFLEKIVLHFSFFYDHPPVEVQFYHRAENHLFEIETLERKARQWELLLSKMKTPPSATLLQLPQQAIA